MRALPVSHAAVEPWFQYLLQLKRQEGHTKASVRRGLYAEDEKPLPLRSLYEAVADGLEAFKVVETPPVVRRPQLYVIQGGIA